MFLVYVPKVKKFLPRISNHFKVYAGEGDSVTPTATPPTVTPVAAVKPEDKKFTQAEVDGMIDKRFKKEKESNERLSTELKGMRDGQGTSQAEKDALQSRIDELEKLTLSKEDLARKDQERLTNAAKKIQDGLSSERDLFRNLYTESQIETALSGAASDPEVKALNAKQIVMLLKSQTRLTQRDVGGKAKFEVLVDWTETDKEGNTTQVQIPAKEALKRMKEQPAVWGNLFESDAKGGLGSGNVQHQGGSLNPASYSSLDSFRKNRPAIMAAK